MPLKLLNWNIEWAAVKSARGRRVSEQVVQCAADILCLTETTTGMLPAEHTITASDDYGYDNHGNRHKVALWSREAWGDVDTVGSAALPGGRFVSGITCGVRVVGVCVPWRMAHVSTGRRDRTVWDDHLAYLAGLATILERYRAEATPVCVVGDYNQTIPRKVRPYHITAALTDCFTGYTTITAGITDNNGKSLIDHIALAKIDGRVTNIIPMRTADDKPMSDHVGVVAQLRL